MSRWEAQKQVQNSYAELAAIVQQDPSYNVAPWAVANLDRVLQAVKEHLPAGHPAVPDLVSPEMAIAQENPLRAADLLLVMGRLRDAIGYDPPSQPV